MKLQSISLDPTSKSLSIVADIDFEAFELFAEPLSRAIDARVIERQWGADRHQWLLDFEGTQIQLNYEFYGDICWLSVERDDEFEVLEFLASLLERQR
ncbi:DUF3630 family protein [Shewanella woodyi]|uniref:DUF3630 family protein n=1 Tax=Shewanella woodyi (strain ATCC 51908 / MS32) TaxID=392500 RepID=B1KPC7_SHEWM|nr:DUF3630 family protein [Shewanella woodyi]ACA84697.1 conserved hypothetical protein [Shewanella woodyi ATCC 51908]